MELFPTTEATSWVYYLLPCELWFLFVCFWSVWWGQRPETSSPLWAPATVLYRLVFLKDKNKGLTLFACIRKIPFSLLFPLFIFPCFFIQSHCEWKARWEKQFENPSHMLGLPSGSVVKDLTMIQETKETRVQSLGWGDCLEKEMATHSSILDWEIPWTEEPGRLPSMGSQRAGHDWARIPWTITHAWPLLSTYPLNHHTYLASVWCSVISMGFIYSQNFRSVAADPRLQESFSRPPTN